jgi:2-polyprenyl-3-methyl-5-hydroxy-6-metoxy-1,4-benzoquinol methylase
MAQWYEELFKDYAESYDKEVYTQGTVQETDFIESELGFDKSKRILDIGCGTGRHAIELAKRGYSVTGVDLSESQLNRAKQKAEDAKVKVDFQIADARKLDFKNEFEAVIMICEGAFSLMETDEMNFAILENAAKALKDGGMIILTTLNVLFPLYHSVKDFMEQKTVDGKNFDFTFDLMTFRDFHSYETVDDKGVAMKLDCNERYYAPSEMSWLLKTVGFKKIEIFGGETGAFERNRPLSTDDFEMLVVAVK